MAFKLGSTDINQLFLGTNEIKKAFLGSTLIFDKTVGAGPPITAGLKAHFEMDDTMSVAPTDILWTDEILGIELGDLGFVSLPDGIVVGGTPTGEDFYFVGVSQGLGSTSINGLDLPSGNADRSLYIVARYRTGGTAGSNQGVTYGNQGTSDAYGLGISNTEVQQVQYWNSSTLGTTLINDNLFHVHAVNYSDVPTPEVRTYLDGVLEASEDIVTLTTNLQKFYLGPQINDGAAEQISCCAILLYDSQHSFEDMTLISDYLHAKYIGT